jgi:hypothetical protein
VRYPLEASDVPGTGGGLLLIRPVTPLTQRDVVYLYSGAHILGRRPFPLLAPGDHGKVLLKKKFSQRQLIGRSFDCASREEAAKGFAQDDNSSLSCRGWGF